MGGKRLRENLLMGKTYSVSPEIVQELDERAEEQFLSASHLVREALDEYLEKGTALDRINKLEQKIDTLTELVRNG